MSDWRAQLRAIDIPRRPAPPSSRPEPPPPRRRVVIPLADLEQAQNESIAEELGLPLEPTPSSFTPPPTTLLPQPETQPSAPPPTEPASMAAKKKAERVVRPPEFKAKVVARLLDLRNAEPRKRGHNAAVAREFKIGEALVSYWMLAHEKAAASSANTLVSSQREPHPMSVVLPPSSLPPLPSVTLTGLEAYVNALVDKRIKERLAALLGGG